MNKIPLIIGSYLLERFEAKGGWTYISLPEILQTNAWRAGGIKVKGQIDGCPIPQARLMRTADLVFLPVTAAIRRQINKRAGDRIELVLYKDESPLEIPAEILSCLDDEPKAKSYFMRLTEGYQREYINWINAAKRPETKAGRIIKMIGKLLKEQTLSKIYE